MSNSSGNRFEELVEQLDRAILPYAGKVAYGNLRRKVTEWGEGEAQIQNLAVIYESPGGSTNQLNIAYRPHDRVFVTVDPETGEETTTDDIDALLDVVLRHVDTIPAYRLERLRRQIDEWHDAGYTQTHIFAELKQLLESDFKGGSLTQEELQQGIRYAVQVSRRGQGTAA